MKYLVVRSWYYHDPRARALISVVDNLWNLLEVPPSTKVVTKTIPKPWWNYNPKSRGFYYGRYWMAWEEWKYCPAQFLLVVDADVIPTNKKALVNLCNFLDRIPPHIGIVTREVVVRVETLVGQRFVHTAGIGFMPSEGISVWQGKYIPSLFFSKVYQYLWVTSPHVKWAHGVDVSEGIYTCGLPPIPMMTFPPEILVLIGTDTVVTEELFSKTNFIHASGSVVRPEFAQVVFTALKRTIEGRF
ncbi:MAG: hypothetical protein QXV20_03970 [Candidatus Hadarchaeales archaeon]